MSTLGWIILLLVIVSAVFLFFTQFRAPVQPQRKPLDSQPEGTSGSVAQDVEVALELTPQELPPLPHRYRENRLVALVQDPLNLFVYWDLADDKLAWLNETHKQDMVLRVHDLTKVTHLSEPHPHWDIIIDLSANNWYVSVPHANGRFLVTLGVRLVDGSFVELLHGNTVTMPRNRQSDQIDNQWPPIAGIQYLFQAGYHMQHTSSAELVQQKNEFRN